MTHGEKLIATLCTIPITLASRAWAGVILWRWFALPIGAPDVTVFHMAGLMLLGAMMTRLPDKKDDEGFVLSVLSGLLIPWFAVLIGCGVKVMMP